MTVARTRLRFRLLVGVALAGVTASVALVSTGAAIAANPPAGPAEATIEDSDSDGVLDAPDTVAAAAAAAAEDVQYEDLSQRTESVSVYANPAGTFTARDFGGAVRIRRSGDWVPVDYTLEEQRDGSWAPKASPIDVTIDGGSSKEAARVTFDDGQSLAVTWPDSLPEPTIDGGVATYKVSESTDLLVAVTASGVNTRIRLNRRPADGDPVFRLGLRAEGVDVDQTTTGDLKVTEDNQTVATTSALIAWDATTDAAGDPANIVELDADLDQTGTNGDVTTHTLDLSTPDGFLTSPDSQYPIVIDPDISTTKTRDTWVRNGDGAKGAEARLIVGKINPATSSNSNPTRTYLKFYSSVIENNDNIEVTSATLGLWQYYAYTCGARQMNIHPVGVNWSDNITWANKPAVVSPSDANTNVTANRGASGGTGTCARGWVTADVSDLAIAWAEGDISMHGLRLTAADETMSSSERRFCSMDPVSSESICNTAARRPYLDITYLPFTGLGANEGQGATAGPSTNQTPAEAAAQTAAEQTYAAQVEAEGNALGTDPADNDGGGADSEGTVSNQVCTAASIAANTCTPNKVLPVKHYNQPNGYFCGPTVGKMIAGYLGKKRGPGNERLSTVALSKTMKTTDDGTPFANFAGGMNEWWGSGTRWKATSSLTNNKLKGILKKSIGDNSRPFAIGTREPWRTAYYNGHEPYASAGLPIEHFITARGYKGAKASKMHLLDPVAKRWGVPKAFTYGTANFRGKFIPAEYGAISWGA